MLRPTHFFCDYDIVEVCEENRQQSRNSMILIDFLIKVS